MADIVCSVNGPGTWTKVATKSFLLEWVSTSLLNTVTAPNPVPFPGEGLKRLKVSNILEFSHPFLKNFAISGQANYYSA